MGREKKSQKSWQVTLQLPNGSVRQVIVRASTVEVASNRALKRHQSAKTVINVEVL